MNSLLSSTVRFILVGGKGGVGKTTTAVAIGLKLAQSFRTLVVSTDPAHSLFDALSAEGLPSKACQLTLRQLDAAAALNEFKKQYDKELRILLDTSSYLDQEDIGDLLSLSIPGLDEVMAFKEIVQLAEDGSFEKVVVDTAPTGHTLRLLALPDMLDEWIKVMGKMRWKYRYIKSAFAGKYTPDTGDDLLVNLKKMVSRLKKLFADPKRAEFILVTKPETMVVSETQRLWEQLQKMHFPVNHLVVNGVMMAKDSGFCQEVKKNQAPLLERIQQLFTSLNILHIPIFPFEVAGRKTIDVYASHLT